MIIEVDVEPFATGGPRFRHRHLDESLADSHPAAILRDEGIDHEGVRVAIPRDVHEADEASVVTRGDPTEAVSLELPAPVVTKHGMRETLRVERVDFLVAERAAPLVSRDQDASKVIVRRGRPTSRTSRRGRSR